MCSNSTWWFGGEADGCGVMVQRMVLNGVEWWRISMVELGVVGVWKNREGVWGMLLEVYSSGLEQIFKVTGYIFG